MTSTLPLYQYCVLFVDAAQRDLWMGNLKQAAGDLKIVVWERGSQPEAADPTNTILVMHQCDLLERIVVHRFCAILSGLSQVSSLHEPSGVLSYPSFLPGPVSSLYTERHARDGVKEVKFFLDRRLAVPDLVIEQAQENTAEVDASKLGIYVDGYNVQLKGPISCGLDEFTFGRGSALGAREWVDMTGIPRELVSGPNYYLPKGKWEITCRFDVDEGAVGMPFTLEWGGDKKFESTALIFDRAGVFEVSIQNEWVFPTPARLRLIMKNSSLGGVVGLLGGELTRL